MSDRRAEESEIAPRRDEKRKNRHCNRELAKARPRRPRRLSTSELNDVIVHLQILLVPHHTLFRASNSRCQREKGARPFRGAPFLSPDSERDTSQGRVCRLSIRVVSARWHRCRQISSWHSNFLSGFVAGPGLAASLSHADRMFAWPTSRPARVFRGLRSQAGGSGSGSASLGRYRARTCRHDPAPRR